MNLLVWDIHIGVSEHLWSTFSRCLFKLEIVLYLPCGHFSHNGSSTLADLTGWRLESPMLIYLNSVKSLFEFCLHSISVLTLSIQEPVLVSQTFIMCRCILMIQRAILVVHNVFKKLKHGSFIVGCWDIHWSFMHLLFYLVHSLSTTDAAFQVEYMGWDITYIFIGRWCVKCHLWYKSKKPCEIQFISHLV